ncbi:MAG: sigma-54 dependent transcriptional regulator [Candidatus Sedimenticola sp. 6PFRAG5]
MEPAPEQQILIVDDDPDHLALVTRWLELENYHPHTALSGQDALASIERVRPDLVITDLVMDGMNGLRLISEIHRYDPVLPVMVLSGQAGIPDALEASHLGVNAFFEKPVKRQHLIDAVNQVLSRAGASPVQPADRFAPRIIYRSKRMGELLSRAQLVAAGDSTVLITGCTGTGKELLAQAIHEGSDRRDAPFISINCSALPEQLLESELFGHEKGAFTGATSRHVGLFEAANTGTLFLDEIGDMPVMLQAKLLRVLQEFKVRPVGSASSIPVDVRIISATHQDLDEMVERKEFRADLYYRLNVVPLYIPNLSERREDIPELVEHFLTTLSERSGKKRKRFSPDAISHLVSTSWPGNIRQLQNVVEQCFVLSPGELIPINLVSEALRDRPGEILPLDEAKRAFERRYLASLLRTTEGNITAAAQLAGRNRTEFYTLLNKHSLEPAAFRKP